MRRCSHLVAGLSVAALLGCTDDVPPTGAGGPGVGFSPFDPATMFEPGTGPMPGSPAFGGGSVANPARAMVTGTLAVTSDGRFVVAADSERDEIVSVELVSKAVVHLKLTAGDEPGRTIAGRANNDEVHAYTVLRGAATIADFNVGAGEVARVATCHAPRGLAYDAKANQVHVACATGELVTYDADTWASLRHLALARDLRDVSVTKQGLLLSRFASAELLLVSDAGYVTSLGEPALPPACVVPTVMHRMVAQGDHLYAAHQLATTHVVLGRNGASECEVAQSAAVYWRAPLAEVAGLSAGASAPPGDADGSEKQPYWLQFVMASEQVPAPGDSLVLAQDEHAWARLGAGAGPLDLAVSTAGRVVVSVAGNFWQEGAPTILTWEHDDEAAQQRLSGFRVGGMVTSVAFDAEGKWIAQSREPAGVYFEDGSKVFLGGASVNNTAYALFHMNTGAGVSCASCHPEGGQDEHVWRFPRGSRRTLPLGPAILPASAYNWDGAHEDIHALLATVLNQQMSYDFVATYEQGQQLEFWLSKLPAPSPGVITDVGAVERGRALFSGVGGCGSCHTGITYTDRTRYDVGTGGGFETPSLLGVGARSQLLHDGCALTLRDVFGTCGGDSSHQVLDRLAPQEVNDLLAFLSIL